MYREDASAFLQLRGFPTSGFFPTFESFVRSMEDDPNMQAVVTRLQERMNLTMADRTALYVGLYANLIVMNAGFPEFHLRPNLVQMLRDTEFPEDLDTELLKLPFEGIVLHVPRGTFGAPGDAVEDIYLTHITGDRFRVVFPMYDEAKTVNYISFVTKPGITISEGIAETKDFVLKNYSKEFLDSMMESAIYADYFRSDVFNLAINASLYLASPDSDLRKDDSKIREIHKNLQGCKRRSKRQHLEALLKKEKARKIYIVGSSVELSREYTAQLTEEGKRASISKRFRVRGHWRNQAFGTAYSERRPKWIAPYWKGPTLAEMLARNYIVGHG